MLGDIFLPLLTYPVPTSRAVIERLPDLVRPFAKTISLCAIEILIPDVHSRLGGELIDVAGLIAAAEVESHAKGQALLEGLPRRVHGIELTGRAIQSTIGTMGGDAAALGRCHDLSVVLLDPLALDKKTLAEEMIFGSGGPVLLVPENIGTAWDIRRICLAWDGGRPAARAMRDGMDLLQMADHVTLLTATDDKPVGEQSIADLKAFLARHEVEVEHREVTTRAMNVGAALQRAAADDGAGLMIMGAFGRNRVTEFVLGGATRTVLDEISLPILLSH
ncbi:MAG: universal stress protein [Devosia sp.]|nr:universal stress protein [Devosia sp.]